MRKSHPIPHPTPHPEGKAEGAAEELYLPPYPFHACPASISHATHRPLTPELTGQHMDDDIILFEDLRHLSDGVATHTKRETNIYHHADPMADFGDRAFKSRYRMAKESALELLAIISPKLQEPKPTGRPPIPALLKLLITIRFLAEGSFQKTVDDNHGHSQSTVSRIVAELCEAIASLATDLIVFPRRAWREKWPGQRCPPAAGRKERRQWWQTWWRSRRAVRRRRRE